MPLFLTSMSGKIIQPGTPVPSLSCRMIATSIWCHMIIDRSCYSSSGLGYVWTSPSTRLWNCLRRAKPGNFCFQNLQHQSVCRRLWPIKKRLPAKYSVKRLGSVVLQVFFPVVVHITSSSRFVGWEIWPPTMSHYQFLGGKTLSKYRSSCKEEFWRPIFDCSSIILDGLFSNHFTQKQRKSPILSLLSPKDWFQTNHLQPTRCCSWFPGLKNCPFSQGPCSLVLVSWGGIVKPLAPVCWYVFRSFECLFSWYFQKADIV